MKSLLIVFCAILFVIFTPGFFTALDNASSDEITNITAELTTAAGQTSANITLSNLIYNSTISKITSISSNISSDTPAAFTFNALSKILTISGLASDSTRTIEITYRSESENLDPMMLMIFSILRWLWVFFMIGFFGAGVYAFFHS